MTDEDLEASIVETVKTVPAPAPAWTIGLLAERLERDVVEVSRAVGNLARRGALNLRR